MDAIDVVAVVIVVDADPADDVAVAVVVVADVSGEPVPCMWFEQSYLNDTWILHWLHSQFAYKTIKPCSA